MALEELLLARVNTRDDLIEQSVEFGQVQDLLLVVSLGMRVEHELSIDVHAAEDGLDLLHQLLSVNLVEFVDELSHVNLLVSVDVDFGEESLALLVVKLLIEWHVPELAPELVELDSVVRVGVDHTENHLQVHVCLQDVILDFLST